MLPIQLQGLSVTGFISNPDSPGTAAEETCRAPLLTAEWLINPTLVSYM